MAGIHHDSRQRLNTMNFLAALTHDQKEALVAGTKLGTVWAAVGFASWADVAAFFAAIYSFLLVCEFLWKKVIKPLREYINFGR